MEDHSYIWKNDQVHDYYGIVSGAIANQNGWLNTFIYREGKYLESVNRFGIFSKNIPGGMHWITFDLCHMPPAFQMALLLMDVII